MEGKLRVNRVKSRGNRVKMEQNGGEMEEDRTFSSGFQPSVGSGSSDNLENAGWYFVTYNHKSLWMNALIDPLGRPSTTVYPGITL